MEQAFPRCQPGLAAGVGGGAATSAKGSETGEWGT